MMASQTSAGLKMMAVKQGKPEMMSAGREEPVLMPNSLEGLTMSARQNRLAMLTKSQQRPLLMLNKQESLTTVSRT